MLDVLRWMCVCTAAAGIASATNGLIWRCISISSRVGLSRTASRILLHVAPTLRAVIKARLGATFYLAWGGLVAPLLISAVAVGTMLMEGLLSMRGSLLHAALKLLTMLDVLNLLVRPVWHARISRLALMRDSCIGVANVAIATWAISRAFLNFLKILMLLKCLLYKLVFKDTSLPFGMH